MSTAAQAPARSKLFSPSSDRFGSISLAQDLV
jgi:hypothetical protein